MKLHLLLLIFSFQVLSFNDLSHEDRLNSLCSNTLGEEYSIIVYNCSKKYQDSMEVDLCITDEAMLLIEKKDLCLSNPGLFFENLVLRKHNDKKNLKKYKSSYEECSALKSSETLSKQQTQQQQQPQHRQQQQQTRQVQQKQSQGHQCQQQQQQRQAKHK